VIVDDEQIVPHARSGSSAAAACASFA
jgi:hypothetical protein